MPATITQRHHPPTESSHGRPHHLARLATAIRAYGGTAVVALSHTAHPVLYVRHRHRTIPVVLVQDIRGGWSFVWGRPATGTPYRIPGVRLYTWATEPAEIVSRGGIRATCPGRTLRDVVLRVDRYTAVCLLDSALNQGLVRSGELPGLAAANRARSGCRRSRPWWELADGRAQSPLETRIRLVCADGGVPPDDLQHSFHDARGRLIAVGDLWWSDRRLLVEADGRAPHELPESLLRDRRRQNALELAHPDVRILRFTWADLACPNYILETVRGVGPGPNEPGSG
ncbi:hypothetical protein GCM10023224_17460 [Streptomonospora halophila]|uniref:DUF559 domain-containing protein n=1 Tax=Streptomonospora halophila TaxID=427369 RepID=A0ABP9GBN4_9ACTN